jgi:hypothetical protein
MNITELEKDYQAFASSSLDIGNKITKSVSMMQLDDVNESVANAVVQIEQLVNKGDKPSALAKLPFFGKYIVKASESVKEEKLRTGQMVETVDRLFGSLNDKKDNIVSVMTTLFDLKEQLASEVETMIEKEGMAKEIALEDGIDGLKARNLLVQVQQTIIKATDRVGIIAATVMSAEASTTAISQLLPSLQGELITEMAIQAGLQELKEFKQIYDLTISTVEDLNATNNSTMKTVMLEVVDLAISTPTDIARLENLNSDRIKFKDQLQAKMDLKKAEQVQGLKVLANVRATQPVLELKQ